MPVPKGVLKRMDFKMASFLTCFHASFFPFCPSFGHPSSAPSLGTLSPFSPSRKVLHSVEQSAQHRAWRGSGSGWTSPQISGRKFLPEICVKKGQYLCSYEKLTFWYPFVLVPVWVPPAKGHFCRVRTKGSFGKGVFSHQGNLRSGLSESASATRFKNEQ